MKLKEKQAVKVKLDCELRELIFTGYDSVVQKTQPRPLSKKLSSFWNKELEIPLLPVVFAAGLFFTVLTIKDDLYKQDITARKDNEIIQIAGSMYWKDDYEKAVKFHENKSEN
ncbi:MULTISPECIES: hypothetical protein [unclassified Sutcliffiella]|uniref:hypothetical protein n=1 Tax=unclassified Sutcliffiella TaxID=2837532 RepID=UPI0030D1975F